MEPIDATDRFLLACLRTYWEPRALAEARRLLRRGGVDWRVLAERAETGGVAPLLYHAVRGQDVLPAPVEDRLRQGYFHTAACNTRLFHDLERVLDGLAEARVPVLLLKGAALVASVYDNPALRPMVDVDLLVRERDVAVALEVLVGLGYESVHDGPLRARDLLAYENEVGLCRPGREFLPIELHWDLFWFPHYRYSIPPEILWRATLPVRVGDSLAWMLGPETQLLHLCGHLLQHYADGDDLRLLWLHDVAQVIAVYHRQIDWSRLLARAQAWDLVQALQRVILRVVDEWGVPVPMAALERLESMRPSPEEERAVAWLAAVGDSPDTYALAGLMGVSGWGERLRFAARTVFPSLGYMQRRYRLSSRFLVPFYYPYRWLSGLRRALMAVVGLNSK